MDTALWRWLTTPNCDIYSHLPPQQLQTNVAQRIEDFYQSPLIVDQSTITGGKPLFTHQVCVGFIVGSEPKYPAWAHQVHLDYFYDLPTSSPSICPPGTCWVFSKSAHRGTQHGPTEYRLGTF